MGVLLHFLGSVWASLYCEGEWNSHRCSFINPEAQMRPAGTGAPAPITLATGSRALALSALGDYRHSLCFWPGRALLPFFIPSQKPGPPGLLCQSFCGLGGRVLRGEPSLPFLPPTPEGHAEFACLPEATTLTSALGQVKGT